MSTTNPETTVAELIEMLSAFPSDAIVGVRDYDGVLDTDVRVEWERDDYRNNALTGKVLIW